MTKTRGGKVTPSVRSTEKIVAETLTRAIAERWTASEKMLGLAAKVSDTTIYNLKTAGTDRVSKKLAAICRVLKIDPEQLLEGEIEDAEPTKTLDLMGLASQLVGTSDEQFAAQFLERLIASRR